MSGSDDSRDWNSETRESINARLNGAKQIQDQVRFTLVVMAIISMMILIASYNAYLSFDHNWVLDAGMREFSSTKTASDILTEQALRSWADSRNVLISLVGIRVNVDDAPVLGTLSLFVMALWLMLLTRRGNRTIGFLLRDTDSLPNDHDSPTNRAHRKDQWLIFHTIISDSLFLNFDRPLARIHSLRGRNPTRPLEGTRIKRIECWLSQFLGGFFFFFPSVACLAMFILDRLSYFQPSPFRPGAAVPGMEGEFFWPSLVVFLVCWIPLLACSWKARLDLTATETLLQKYRDKLLTEARKDSRSIPTSATA
jgi:hypothetical protein